MRNIWFRLGGEIPILLDAFLRSGFWGGVGYLSKAVNVFGTLFVLVLELIFDIPLLWQNIIRNCITTLIILFGCAASIIRGERKARVLIVCCAVSLLLLFLSWSNIIPVPA